MLQRPRGWTSEMLPIACKYKGRGCYLGTHPMGGGNTGTRGHGTIHIYIHIIGYLMSNPYSSCWSPHHFQLCQQPRRSPMGTQEPRLSERPWALPALPRSWREPDVGRVGRMPSSGHWGRSLPSLEIRHRLMAGNLPGKHTKTMENHHV